VSKNTCKPFNWRGVGINDFYIFKMINKTQIEKRIRHKTNPELVGVLIKLKKSNPEIAKLFARPVKRWARVNLDEIEGDKVLIGGKVLSSGELKEKSKIIAWSASGQALEKIEKAGGEFINLKDVVHKDIKLEDFKVLR